LTAELRADEGDERAAVEAAVAVGLAELSAVEVVPSEVDETTPFDAVDVHFDGGNWVHYLLRVRDWLRLSCDVEPTADIPMAVARLFAGMDHPDPTSAFVVADGAVVLTDVGLEAVRDRLDRALELKDRFEEALEENTKDAATAIWIESWDSTVEETINGPITAKAGTWTIGDFSGRAEKGRLELSPSYQRGDVWPAKDSQLLIESILRGIPLPSIIILKPGGSGEVPYEVVDGKQRLTAILRFIGAHPKALQLIKQKNAEFPEGNLLDLFRNDYPNFRKAWKNATGDALTSTREKDLYFPFKLSASSPALAGDLEPLRGKYYHEILERMVKVGGDTVDVSDLFTKTTGYLIPIIEYTDATPRQIHEVFNLYNKQGKHLNAEEIRNAVYHELDLMRALAVAAGDNEDLRGATEFLIPVESEVRDIAVSLDEYRIGDTRYRRTKVLSWLVSILVSSCAGPDGAPRLLSTSSQINALLDRVQASHHDPLRSNAAIRRLMVLVSTAMQAHAMADAWDPKFRDNAKGVKWQELQLVASLLGVSIAAAVVGGEIEDLLLSHESDLMNASRSSQWKRPPKTQTATQWTYIATVAMSILEILDIDRGKAAAALQEAFGSSCIDVLATLAK
jgi:hypothetical protein